MPKILELQGWPLLDCQGRTALEVQLRVEGAIGRASVEFPGDSIDADLLGRLRSVVDGLDVTDQVGLDSALDNAPHPGKPAVERAARWAVSLAAARAAAAHYQVEFYRHIRFLTAAAGKLAQAEETTIATIQHRPRTPDLMTAELVARLPLPLVSLLASRANGGGLGWARLGILPVGAESPWQAFRLVHRVWVALAELLGSKGYPAEAIESCGAFCPPLHSPGQALDILLKAIESAGLKPGRDVVLGADFAAGRMFSDGSYQIGGDLGEGGRVDSAGLVAFYADLVAKYPVMCLIDPLAPSDRAGWDQLMKRLAGKAWWFACDVFTDSESIWRGWQVGIGNGALLELSRHGTLTELLRNLSVARLAGYAMGLGVRGRLTGDNVLADLAVGAGVGLLSIGGSQRGERTSIYNRLLAIDRDLRERSGQRDAS